MSALDSTLKSFRFASIFFEVFSEFPYDYEFDELGILRRTSRPECPVCGNPMNKNGYNSYTKKGLGTIRIGRWSHNNCGVCLEEDRSFWRNLIDKFFLLLKKLTMVLKRHHMSYVAMSEVLSFIYPRSQETCRNLLANYLKNIEFSESEFKKADSILIIHYDEQHPKQGRAQKFRLTLFDHMKAEPIADELYDDKSPETIKEFLGKYLDPKKPVFIVTDFYSSYPNVFDDFFENGYYHQKCLLHLNKLIVKGFSRNCSMENELLKYEFLNIFYDRSKEVRYLKRRVRKERSKKNTSGYRDWLKKTKHAFHKYLRKLENKRRRKKKSLKLRSHNGSVRMLNKLMRNYNTFPKKIQKRLRMIGKNWSYLTMFHHFKGAPATNNVIENYYSTSLKSHQKRQYTSDKGIKDQIKLARLRRLGRLGKSRTTIPKLLRLFAPFSIDPG